MYQRAPEFIDVLRRMRHEVEADLDAETMRGEDPALCERLSKADMAIGDAIAALYLTQIKGK